MNFNRFTDAAIPYVSHGRSYDGCDCWGLVYLFYRDELGITLPSWSAEYEDADELPIGQITERADCFSGWELVAGKPSIGAVGLFEVSGNFHVGICADKFGRQMLHIMKNRNVTIENINSVAWKSRFRGWYRYAK